MPDIINMAHFEADFRGETVEADSQVTVTAAEVIFEKEAEPMVWVSGDLTYTLRITNNELYPLTSVIITDTLQSADVSFVAGSVAVTINGSVVTPANVDYTDPVLTIELSEIPAATDLAPEPIEPAIVVITFLVTKP